MSLSHVRTIQEFLAREGLVAHGAFARDIASSNVAALQYPAYLIRECSHLPNVREKVDELCSCPDITAEHKAQYANLLTELFGVWFSEKKLGERVVGLESRSHQVDSSHRPAGSAKSCDFSARSDAASVERFYEVKDYSAQELRMLRTSMSGGLLFKPAYPSETAKWILARARDAIRKGANRLICRVPVWTSASIPRMDERWLRQLFPRLEATSPGTFAIPVQFSVPSYFEGVFLAKPDRFLVVRLVGS